LLSGHPETGPTYSINKRCQTFCADGRLTTAGTSRLDAWKGRFSTRKLRDTSAAHRRRGDGIQESANMKILFIAGFGPIIEADESRKMYRDVLSIPFKEEADGYLHTEAVPGAKSFALWPLSQAAQSCFDKDSWPADLPVPRAWLEFDVDSVEEATTVLESAGYRMLVKNKKEP
jgi:hypothetical protein